MANLRFLIAFLFSQFFESQSLSWLITKNKINTMKFALSLYFIATFLSTPAMAGLRSSRHPDDRETRVEEEAVHHGRQVAGNRQHRRHHKGGHHHHQGATSLDNEANEFDTKIVGGNAASIGEYPYFGTFCCFDF
jgi:hypothetical protein